MDKGAPGLALVPGAGPLSWQARVEERLCAGWPGSQFLFGGFGIAGCVDAMERATSLPTSVAACHFVSPARPDEILTYSVTASQTGLVRQALVIASCGERLVARMLGVAGTKGGEQVSEDRPLAKVPGPDECLPFSTARLMSSNVHALFEARLVDGQVPDRAGWTCEPVRECRFWVRFRSGEVPGRAMLSVMGDFVGVAIPGAVGAPAGGTSLDNHVRFVRDAASQWVLCDVTIDAVAAGLLHGRIAMFDEAGGLLATGSQTMVFRRGT